MIRKIEHKQNMWVKSYDYGFKDTHIETHLITIYWFFFIPIYKSKKLIIDTLNK